MVEATNVIITGFHTMGAFFRPDTLGSPNLAQQKVCDSPHQVVVEDVLHLSSFVSERSMTISYELKELHNEVRSLPISYT